MLARSVRVEVVRKVPADAILVDLDDGAPDIATMRERLNLAGYIIGWSRKVRSRHHWHVIVRVYPRPKTLHERVALQLLCGSDVRREANNLRRARALPYMPLWAKGMADVLYTGE